MGKQSAAKRTTRLCVSEAAIERRKEKSSSVKTQQLGNLVKTHEFDQPFQEKKLCRSIDSDVEEDIRTVGRGGRKVRSLFLYGAQQIAIGEV